MTKDPTHEELYHQVCEADTCPLVRDLVAMRARLTDLEVTLRMVVSRGPVDEHHDWLTCPQASCALARRVLGEKEPKRRTTHGRTSRPADDHGPSARP